MALTRLALGAAGEITSSGITANGQSVGGAVDAINYASAVVQVTGTFVATLTFQVSNDGTNWVTKSMNTPAGAIVTTATAAGLWSGDLGGRYFRVTATAFTSGTATVTIQFSGSSYAAIRDTQPISGTVTANLGVGTAGPGKLEDVAAASGDMGMFVLGVRRDVPTVSASAAGDYNEVATGRHGELFVRPLGAAKRTYALAGKITPYAGQVLEIAGSASATIEVTRLSVSLYGTAAGKIDVILNKRSTASSGGTSTTPAKVPTDATDAAATAVVKLITAAPTAGTLIGAVRQGILSIVASQVSNRLLFDSIADSKSITLNAATQALTIDLAGTMPAGAELAIDIEWTEY